MYGLYLGLTHTTAHMNVRPVFVGGLQRPGQQGQSVELLFEVGGMSCANCSRKVETTLLGLRGVRSASVSR